MNEKKMVRKRAAQIALQSNELNLPPTGHKLQGSIPSLVPSSSSSSTSQNAINSHATMCYDKSMMSINQKKHHHHQQQQQLKEQQQQQLKEQQQQTLVKINKTNMAPMSSSSSSAAAASFLVQSNNRMPSMKYWQDELIDFSAHITRQAHFTLGRIAIHFSGTGMKFDANFRNHFLYIAHNRILESYDSFLMDLPRDMKCEDYQLQRFNLNPVRPSIQVNRQQLIEPPKKRKRIESVPTVHLPSGINKIGPQFSTEKVATKQTSNATTTVTTTSSSSTSTATATTATNVFKIQKVASLHRSNGSPANPLKEPLKEPLNGSIAYGDQEKKSSIPIKILERHAKIWRPLNVIPVGHVNAQSTPNKPAVLQMHLKKSAAVEEDPLKIDTTAAEVTTKASSNNGSQRNIKENKRPAHSQIATLQTNKELSISLPIALSTTAAAAAANSIITRSRANPEHPKTLFECDYACGFTTGTKQNLMRHHIHHTGVKSQTCKICNKRFARKPLLLAHMRENHHDLHSDLAYWDIE